MGLIKTAIDVVKGSLADQWLEYFYCDSLSESVLMTKGVKRANGTANKKANDNIISNGSIISVADGQCMLIVEQGKIVEVCAEPGEFKYDSSTEPSIFAGNLGTSIVDTFKQIGKRFTFGGDTAKDQRVYYINTKHINDNKFGTATPIPFRVVDSRIFLDIDVEVRCNGIYIYKIANPLLFYTNIAGNMSGDYTRDQLYETMRSELLSSLGPAFARISELEIRPNQLVSKNTEITDALKVELTEKWSNLRGIELVNVSFNSVSIPSEQQEEIRAFQRKAVYTNPGMAAAHLVESQGEAMKTAAGNEGGAMLGFMGMNVAMQAGGANANQLYQQQAQNQQMQQQMAMQQAQTPNPAQGMAGQPAMGMPQAPAGQPQMAPASQAPATDSWICTCGATGTGKFCMECGNGKPEAVAGWACTCGATNTGKFCPECGAKKPEEAPLYKCDKCGWAPEDPKNPPKFCPECGDVFDDNDIQK